MTTATQKQSVDSKGNQVFELTKVKPKEFIESHANATPAFLVDQLRYYRDAENLAKGQSGLIKTMLFARVDPPIQNDASVTDISQYHNRTLKGETRSATVKYVQQSRFDQEAFQKDHPDLFEKYQKTIAFLQVDFDKE
ncbi:MAG: hypothetical protein AB7L09_21500 [Nitrospira sp.]